MKQRHTPGNNAEGSNSKDEYWQSKCSDAATQPEIEIPYCCLRIEWAPFSISRRSEMDTPLFSKFKYGIHPTIGIHPLQRIIIAAKQRDCLPREICPSFFCRSVRSSCWSLLGIEWAIVMKQKTRGWSGKFEGGVKIRSDENSQVHTYSRKRDVELKVFWTWFIGE